MTEFWFNTTTGEVEEGRVSDWSVVLGPFPTREAAARALETARTRSAAWDREDRDDDRWAGARGTGTHDDPDGLSSDDGPAASDEPAPRGIPAPGDE
ncbi:MAG TPA: hypothetical protein VGC04_12615 [Cellulomonas sp.]